MDTTQQHDDPKTAEGGYRRILKSTFIMGASSVFITFMGIVRTKVLAMMLGPAGLGLTGIYLTVTNLVATLSRLGIGESGVRQIAGASGTGDDAAIARTLLCLRRMSLLSGIVGCGALLFLCGFASRVTFGDGSHTQDLALLSVSLFFGAVSSGQIGLLQGMRRIGDLAKLSMCGAVFGTIFSIPIIYFFGARGIALFLITVAATEVLTSWWYSRKIKLPSVSVSWRESFADAKPLVQLGTALMCGALMWCGTQYFLRVFVIRYLGLAATGIYQASTTLSFIYVDVILRAMATDFYPRLSAAAENNNECRSLVNKQIEVGLLLAVPGILAIVGFAPLVITTFYSPRFVEAVDILRWQILGVLLQVVTSPLGFFFRAKSDGKLFVWTEAFANGMHVAFAWLGITLFGLPGIGMAFLGMNICYFILVFWIVRHYYAFRFSADNVRIFLIFLLAITAAFSTRYFLPNTTSIIVNTLITICVGIFSLRSLIGRASEEAVPSLLLKLKAAVAFGRGGTGGSS